MEFNIESEFGNAKSFNYVHIRIQQRNSRKVLTTIQGLPVNLDYNKVLRAFKKVTQFNSDSNRTDYVSNFVATVQL